MSPLSPNIRSPHQNDAYDRSVHVLPASLSLILGVAALGAIYYASYVYNPANIGDLLPYTMVAVAEGIILFQALIAIWTILAGSYNPRDFHYKTARTHLLPATKRVGKIREEWPLSLNGLSVSVDVFITVYGEPLATIERTALAAKHMTGKHATYILDDGRSDAVAALAREIGVNYLRRSDNVGAKAGNVNAALARTDGDYFVILDADHVPEPNFLEETVPFFNESKVAFVQTPQTYVNLETPVARGAAYAQELFYRYICTGKNRFNAAFCVGTNVIFRRTAIATIGGIYQASNSEDIWTSIRLHELGYKSVFIPDVLARGQAPDTIAAFTKQQLRWATGGFEVLKYNPLLSKGLTFDQKLQYLSTATFYLLGLAAGLMFFVPAMTLLLALTPMAATASFGSWVIHYAAFNVLQILIGVYCMRGLKIETIVLAMGSFPTYVRALTNVIFARSVKWQATNRKSADRPIDYLVPQVLAFVFLLVTSAIGIYQIANGMNVLSLALGSNFLNLAVFGYYLRMAFAKPDAQPSTANSRVKALA